MSQHASRPETTTRVLAWAVLVAAVLQVVAPALTFNGPGESPGEGAGPDLLITPVGWAFSIWGVIYTLAIAQAIAALATGGYRSLSRRLQLAQVVLYLGGTLWIAMAALDSSLATAAALLVMFLAALTAVLTVAGARLPQPWLTWLTRAAVGLYAGWVTAAFFLNASTALVDADVASADTLGWQVAMLALAVLTLAAVTVRTGALAAYLLAGLWALLGIGVTGRADDNPEVVIAAVVAAIVLAAAAAVGRLVGSDPDQSSPIQHRDRLHLEPRAR